MVNLHVGETQTREISARSRGVETGVLLAAGSTYELTAIGTWRDWNTVCGPDGYVSPNALLRAAERWRRVPAARWFALIGAVGGTAPFVIGSHGLVSAPGSGELICFANDLALLYFNNHGSVTLTIQRVS